MKLLRIAAIAIAVTVVSAIAWAGYGGDTGSGQVADKKRTTSIALPEKTNNAWELKPFKLEGLDGEKHTLDEWKGKVIVLNFWASWCAPCQYEIKDLVKLQSEYGEKGLQVIGIGIDEARKLANVKRTLEINYPVLVADPTRSTRLLSRWGNDRQIVPYTVVIDRDGTIRYIHRGQLTPDVFGEFVIPLLTKSG